jgi:hypothetical protein
VGLGPGVVKNAIDKAFPRATVGTCKAEREHGHDQFEVKLTKADGGKAEVDVADDGKIIQVEEAIAVDQLPAAVTKAVATRYPKAKVNRAEKQTPASGPVSYEVALSTGKEATFTADGTFVEEE